MTALLLAIQFVVTIAMIGTILLQRSEGGALGLGGGGGVSGLMSGRGAANALSRTTVILAAIFIVTSLALALIARHNARGSSIAPTGQGSGIPTSIPVLPGAPTPSPGPIAPSPSGSAAPGSQPAAPSPSVPAVPVPSAPAPATPSPTPSPAPAAPAGGTP